MRLMIGIAAFLIWAGGSGYWYACKVKGACSDTPREVWIPEGEEPENEEDFEDRSEEDTANENTGEEAAIAALGAEVEDLAEEGGELEAVEEGTGESEEIVEDEIAVAEEIPIDLKAKRTVLFSFAKPIMNERADLEDYIEAAADFLQSHPGTRMRIVGYTDDTAARENNLKLGMRRAEAVADLLRAQGVSDEQLDLISGGEKDPVASNDTRAGRQRNRRAELQLIDHSE